MTKFENKHLRLTMVTVGILVGCRAAGVQQPPTHTLMYHPEQQEWVELSPSTPGTAAGDLHIIRTQIDNGEHGKALSSIEAFTKQHGPDDPGYPGVLISKAEALIGRRAYFKAHTAIQEFLNRFGGSERTADALRLDVVIAEAYLGGAKRKVLGLSMLSGVDLAYRILDDISTDYPETRFAVLAIKTKAGHLFQTGEYAMAELEYQRLIEAYPNSRYHQHALRRSAEATLASFAGVDYDEAPLIDVEERYHEYRNRYPAAAQHEGVDLILESVRELRAEKELLVGSYYERTEHFSSAIFYYRFVLANWADTAAAVKAKSRMEFLGALVSPASAGASKNAATIASPQ